MAGFGPEDQGGEGNIPPIVPPASEKIEDLDLFQKGIHVCREKFPADGALERFYQVCLRALTLKFPKVAASMPDFQDAKMKAEVETEGGALESHEVDPYLKALQAFKCDGKKCSDAQIKARAQSS